MGFEVESLGRSFKYDGKELADIPGMSLEQVKDFYSNSHPELNNANIGAPNVVDGVMVYEFAKKMGTKG